MTAYYNENDPYAAQWLRNLIAAGHIAPGDVDERSIEDVVPTELAGYHQCHFFAGIGVWSYALRRAGWPDDRPVWTGSCPCQPFSDAGKRGGTSDERHLWPAWFHLIEQCGPTDIFGEQVASKDGLAWLDLVQADLEGTGYAVGAADLCAAGVGAPHIRQRLWFYATAGGLGYADDEGSQIRGSRPDEKHVPQRRKDEERPSGLSGFPGRMAETKTIHRGASPTNGHWRAADWLYCRDGKWRCVEPGAFTLAYGAPARVGRLRAYGNAIVSEAAQAFIESVK